MIHRSPHDQFVKAILGHPEKARAYFELQLPKDLSAILDLTHLKLEPGSFVDKTLKETFSDLLFKAPLKDRDAELYLSLLLEHKSSADPHVTIQMGHYIFSALHRQVSQGARPIPVIPILLYHGKEPMTYRTHRTLYEEWGPEVLPFVPDFDYVYHNLQGASEESIAEVRIAAMQSLFLLLKYSHSQRMLLAHAARILLLASEDGNHLGPYFVYFASLIKEKSKLMESILDLPNPLQHKARNAYEAFLLEGMEKGLKKGREEGREKGREEGARQALIQSIKGMFLNGISTELIAKSLELTTVQVSAILREEGLLKNED